MKIRVIGSGSMWTKYNSASYMIDDDILVDVPNGMCKNLYRMNIDPKKIKHVLLTHFHGDHYFDMPFLFLLKARSNAKVLNIYCSREGRRKITKLFKLAFPNSLKGVNNDLDINYNFEKKFKIGKYEITKQLVDHGRMKPAYGYIVEYKNIKVGFTGDSAFCKSIEDMASMCTYLFCDAMFINGTDKHMGIDNIKTLSEEYPNCKFIVSHLEDITRKELGRLNLNNVIIPEDGTIIET